MNISNEDFIRYWNDFKNQADFSDELFQSSEMYFMKDFLETYEQDLKDLLSRDWAVLFNNQDECVVKADDLVGTGESFEQVFRDLYPDYDIEDSLEDFDTFVSSFADR